MLQLFRPLLRVTQWSANAIHHLRSEHVECWHCHATNRVRPATANHVPICGVCRARLGPIVLLCDVSQSMNSAAGGGRTRMDHLRDAVQCLLPLTPQPRLIAFSVIAREFCDGDSLPEPSGGTAMHLGFSVAASLHPRRTILISDGEADDALATIDAVRGLPGALDGIYCGSEADRRSIDFMQRLVRMKNGDIKHCNVDPMNREPNPFLPPLLKLLSLPPSRRLSS